MKRLTIRNNDGTVSQSTDLWWANALERLSEYEDTGMEPEEIIKMRGEVKTAYDESCTAVVRDIENLPVADVAPVRHGHWIRRDGYTECSECDYWYNSTEHEDAEDLARYCPRCGAIMDIVEKG